MIALRLGGSMRFAKNFTIFIVIGGIASTLWSCRQRLESSDAKTVVTYSETQYICKDISIDAPSDDVASKLVTTSPFQNSRKTELTFDLGESPVWIHVFADGKEVPNLKFTGLDLYARNSQLASLSGASAGNGRPVDEYNQKVFDLKLWMPGGFFEINETVAGKIISRHGTFKCSHN